jgi:hypothetical protein
MNTPQTETPISAPEFASYDITPPKKNKPITAVEYKAFQRAYDFFNAQLFDGSLPHVLVTLQRRARTRGYFSPDRFSGRTAQHRAHELALNPDGFDKRSDEDILSVLVHEMAHVWQQVYGKPGCGRYHNRQWAEKMKEIGLYPSDTAEPGGKKPDRAWRITSCPPVSTPPLTYTSSKPASSCTGNRRSRRRNASGASGAKPNSPVHVAA